MEGLTKSIIICDVCGKETEKKLYYTVETREVDIEGFETKIYSRICPECYEKLRKLLGE